MPANRPTQPVPPTSRRSARQQRLASREANRQLARAGTGGVSNASMRTLMLWTGVAVVIGAIVIGGAYLFTRPSGQSPNGVGDPTKPWVVTPSDIPSNGLTLGDPNAKVTIDAWEDFRCSYCFDFTTNVEPQLVQNYIETGKAKLVYHDYLTIDAGQGNTASRDAANAARCAADQGKFWTMHDWLFANQSPTEEASAFSQARLLQIGQMAGMDMSRFQPCVQQGTHNAEITTEESRVPDAAKNNGTPSILVNGKFIANQASMDTYYANIAAEIDGILNPTPSPSVTPAPSTSASTSASASATATPTPTGSAS